MWPGDPLRTGGCRGCTIGGPSLPCVQLRDLERALFSYDQLGVSLPENFLVSLSTVLVVSLDQGIAVAGSFVADSLASVRACGV